MSKKYLIAGLVILIILAVVLVIYFFYKPDLCKKIDNEALKQECSLCNNAYDIVDCKERVYIRYAILNKDVFLCKNIIRDYNKEDCLARVNFNYKRGGVGAEPVQ